MARECTGAECIRANDDQGKIDSGALINHGQSPFRRDVGFPQALRSLGMAGRGGWVRMGWMDSL